MKLRLAAVGLLTMLAVAGCGKKEEQAADQNAAATAPAASNTTATAPAPAATDNTTNTQQAAATPAASTDKIGDCELTGKKGETPITPAVAGQLTVETNLPGPGWYNGDTPES